jgi:hypothetical protein
LLFFWVGFILDPTGTTLMGEIAGKMDCDVRGITGALAIFLILGHASLELLVLLRK